MARAFIGDHPIGRGNPPFFVAELGICHGGSVDVALELAEMAANAGAHCVKTETFQRKNMVFDPSAKVTYTIQGKRVTESLAAHMDRYELSFEDHRKIKERCDELSLPFMSTAHDFAAVDFLAHIGAAAVKISSPDIVHYPLLRHVAQKGLPVVMDTGAALQYEVELAVNILRESGLENIIVNHNPGGHPAPADQHDLRVIPRLQEILDLPVGIADHYEGYEMLYAAAAIGTDLLEKPISMDRFAPEPERGWSISASDLEEVLGKVKEVYSALGRRERTLTAEAKVYRDRNRMACAAAKDLGAGQEINLENITFGRPRKGIGVEDWDLIQGRKLRRPKNRYAFIQWQDLD